ncbi:hypothetical protein PM082_006640 [Marasmius tenuissimus]|nr:hypothetical protein PM082_006640 [Marasmius tenuissimus]
MLKFHMSDMTDHNKNNTPGFPIPCSLITPTLLQGLTLGPQSPASSSPSNLHPFERPPRIFFKIRSRFEDMIKSRISSSKSVCRSLHDARDAERADFSRWREWQDQLGRAAFRAMVCRSDESTSAFWEAVIGYGGKARGSA